MPSQSHELHPRQVRAAQIAPGVHIVPVDPKKIPCLLVCEAVKKRVTFEDGTKGIAYVYVERVNEAWLRITEAAKLPIGVSEQVIHTLVRAGFVEGGRAGPNSCTVNVRSLLDHIQETADDPDYWTTERKLRYKDWVPKWPCRKKKKSRKEEDNA